MFWRFRKCRSGWSSPDRKTSLLSLALQLHSAENARTATVIDDGNGYQVPLPRAPADSFGRLSDGNKSSAQETTRATVPVPATPSLSVAISHGTSLALVPHVEIHGHLLPALETHPGSVSKGQCASHTKSRFLERAGKSSESSLRSWAED